DMDLQAEVRPSLKMIEDAGGALLSLINDILDLSRIEAGRLRIESARFDLLAAVEEVAALLGHAARRKNLRLIVRYAPDAPRIVHGDEGRIRQVLTNLVANAVKFTARGHVLIDVETAPRESGMALFRVAVADTGIGIPADRIEAIFEKFTQADSSTTRKYGGTGLGLAICRQLITLMGGTIGAESEPDRGSTFWFGLPLACDPPAAGCPGGPRGEWRAPVLIALENEVEACAVLEALSAAGMSGSLCAAGDLPARLDAARAAGGPTPAALIDAEPDKDAALDLGRRIRERDPGGVTALVLVLGGPDPELEARARAGGFLTALSRPLLPSALRGLPEELLPGSRAAQGVRTAGPAPGDDGRLETPPPPSSLAALPLPTAPCERGAREGGPLILVVEDNLFNQRVAALMLDRLGCRCDLAADGKEALARLAAGRYEMILMDCEMPIMDGFEASAAIRALPDERAQVPIVAMTAHTRADVMESCLAAGMDEVIGKPIVLETMRAVVSRWTSRSSPIQRGA
ncbi:MAG: response regulator, partial [Candidatus Eisenbacteria bacterium]|nr:response regulator [Candidatus Eisenbacteria bacterium]